MRPHTSAKENVVRIRSPYGILIGITSKFNGNFLAQWHIRDKIIMKIQSLSLEAKQWKNALSRNVEESLKKFLDLDLEVDDFQNLISSSLFTDTYMCGKIFMKIRSVVFM